MQNKYSAQHSLVGKSALYDAYRVLSAYKYLFLASVIVCLVCAYFYQINTITRYRVNTVLNITVGNLPVSTKEITRQIRSLQLNKEIKKTSGSTLLTVAQGPKQGTIVLRAEDKDADNAQVYLNSLINLYKLYTVKQSDVIIDTTTNPNKIKLLNDKLALLTNSAQPPKPKVQKPGTDSSTPEEKQDAKRQMKILEVVLSYLHNPLNKFVIIPDNFVAYDNELEALVDEFNELQTYKQSILSDDQPDEAGFRSTNQRILLIVQQIKNYVTEQKAVLAEAFGHKSSNEEIHKNRNTLQQKNRATAAQIKLLNNSIKSIQEHPAPAPSRSALQIEQGNYTVTPVHSQSYLPYLSAIVLGLLVPALAINALKKNSKKINRLSDISKLTTIEIAGELKAAASTTLTFINHNDPSFMALSNFFVNRLNFDQKVLWVTSAQSGEGKKHLTLGLAQELAYTSKKVIVIDYGLGSTDLLEELEVPYHQGLQEYLSKEEVSFTNLIMPSPNYSNLSFIGAGVAREQLKMDMLSMLNYLDMPMVAEETPTITENNVYEKFGKLLKHLRSGYDYIIINGPSIEENRDPFNLARLADATIYTVRCNFTYKAQVIHFNELANNGQHINPFIVINSLHNTA